MRVRSDFMPESKESVVESPIPGVSMENFLAFEEAAKLTVEERWNRYFRPDPNRVPGEYRAFDTMREYREWCDENMPPDYHRCADHADFQTNNDKPQSG